MILLFDLRKVTLQKSGEKDSFLPEMWLLAACHFPVVADFGGDGADGVANGGDEFVNLFFGDN